jgi:peptidyl-prolyl cis-trans isomerase-like protein 2
VQLTTSAGVLNLELRCDRVPKTCDNFVRHCNAGYYDGTIFHRSIKHFMIQGGDPTGTGKGGESAFPGAAPFQDEFQPDLSHSGRGVLSMANSGVDSNKAQFFITYRSCNHLDNKHTVFGSVVGGMEALLKMERIETDDGDRPKEAITIIKAKVFVDPFKDLEVQEQQERDAAVAATAKAKAAAESTVPALAGPVAPVHAKSGGVGRYIKPAAAAAAAPTPAPTSAHAAPQITLPSAKKAKKKGGGGFGDFSGW